MHGSGDYQPNVQKSKIQSYNVEHCTLQKHMPFKLKLIEPKPACTI